MSICQLLVQQKSLERLVVSNNKKDDLCGDLSMDLISKEYTNMRILKARSFGYVPYSERMSIYYVRRVSASIISGTVTSLRFIIRSLFTRGELLNFACGAAVEAGRLRRQIKCMESESAQLAIIHLLIISVQGYIRAVKKEIKRLSPPNESDNFKALLYA